jgi:hypothetical protein
MLPWLRRLLHLHQPAPEVKPADERTPIDDLRDHIRRDVANGFLDEDAILTGVVEIFEEDMDPELVRREAPGLLRTALAEHALDERKWPAQTDCDRLDAAFAALESDGVVSRQNFSCCGTCGSSEIWGEIEEAEKGGLSARGYTFFHVQDTEAAVEGQGLYLNYGACEQGEAASVAIGHDIVAKLNAHGLRTNWDGSLSKRIHVSLDWKKRRTLRSPDIQKHLS